MKHLIFVIIILSVFVSCTGKFEEINTDPTGYSDELQRIDYNYYGLPLINVQQGIYFNYDWGAGKNWTFQTMQNLGADMFAGYFHNYKPFVGGQSNTVYNLNDSWNSTMWEYTYWYIVPQGKDSEDRNRLENEEFYGINKILKVLVLHRLTDIYGPIMYNDFGTVQIGGIPDSQKVVYYSFFEDIQTGIEFLNKYIDSEKFVKFDILMPEGKKNYRQWIKTANSLRLRLAMRISKVDPIKAREEAEKSLTDSGGLLEDVDDIVAVSTVNTVYTNPLGEINKSWGEVIMNANIESILGGYDDPRLSKFFEPTTDENLNEIYKGIRQGTGFNHEKYKNHSKSTISHTFNPILITSAEVWFLKAEVALKGWNGGNIEYAKYCYEQGIRNSCRQWGVSYNLIEEYLQSDAKPKPYKDAFNPEYDIEARCNVSPKWDTGNDDPEEKFEKIITQKWIACYPEGCEAWAEQRRTGYPRLFPVKVNMSHGTIDSETMIRRLNFPVSIKSSYPEQYERLINLLEGVDNGGTRLWWDTGGPNFP